MTTPRTYQVLTSDGHWLGDFATIELAELFKAILEQIYESLPAGEVRSQYDADRLGA